MWLGCVFMWLMAAALDPKRLSILSLWSTFVCTSARQDPNTIHSNVANATVVHWFSYALPTLFKTGFGPGQSWLTLVRSRTMMF